MDEMDCCSGVNGSHQPVSYEKTWDGCPLCAEKAAHQQTAADLKEYGAKVYNLTRDLDRAKELSRKFEAQAEEMEADIEELQAIVRSID